MRILFLCLLTTICVFSSQAQIFPRGQVWFNTDSVPLESRLIGRHALLAIEFNLHSRGISDLQREVEELSIEYPWLSTVAVHLPSRSQETDPVRISRYLDKNKLKIAVLVDTISTKMIPLTKTGIIRFDLRNPKGEFVLQDLAWTPSNRELIKEQLDLIATEYSRPGKTLSSSYMARIEPKLSDSRLLSYPSHMIFDDSQQRLMISDTGHDRVVISSEDGQIRECIGSGVSGDALGEFDMCNLNSPMGLVYLPGQDKLFIADHGSSRILLAIINSRQVNEFQLKDEDGFDISLPSAPTDLTLSDDRLSITMPLAHKVWVVNVNSGRLIKEHGQDGPSMLYSSKTKKLVLGKPISSLESDGHLYTYDSHMQTILDLSDKTVEPLWSLNQEMVKEEGGILSEDQQNIIRLRKNQDILFAIDADSGEIIEVDLENSVAGPMVWNTDSIEVGMISDMAWSEDNLYLLDSEFGEVVVLGPGLSDRVRWSEVNRLNSGPFKHDHLIVHPDITVSDSVQTTIELSIELQDRFVLHPMHKSSIFLAAGSKIYTENNDLNAGNLKFITMSDFKKNQINLMGEIYFTEVGNPWKVYKRWIQIMLPVMRDKDAEKDILLKIDLTDGLSVGD